MILSVIQAHSYVFAHLAHIGRLLDASQSQHMVAIVNKILVATRKLGFSAVYLVHILHVIVLNNRNYTRVIVTKDKRG